MYTTLSQLAKEDLIIVHGDNEIYEDIIALSSP